VRRPGPRPLSAVLDRAMPAVAPATVLARVQTVWPEVAGPAVSAAAAPVAERARVVTVVCESAGWAHELELLARDLKARLNERLGAEEEAPVGGMRFVVGSVPSRVERAPP
jgi:predicted nucleic acid-binding Zn ribbon protein